MKFKIIFPRFLFALLVTASMLLLSAQRGSAQTAWASAAAGNWNTSSSWNPAFVPAEGTNATIANSGTFAITYNSAMAASSIGALTFGLASSSASVPTLTITANGFNVSGTTTLTGTSGEILNVNSGGVMTNGTLNFNDYNAIVNVNSGGTMTNGNTQVANNGSNDGNGALKINSGAVVSLGAVTVGRNNQGTGQGLIISGGTVSASSIAIGTRNSYSTMVVSGGTITNSGSLQIGTGPGTSSREVRYYQTGGTVGCAGTLDLPVAANYPAWFSVLNSASTFSADGIRLYPNVVSGSSVKFTNSGVIYLGATGFNALNSGSYTVSLNDQSILGANADWSANINFTAPSGTITFKCADANNNAHNITLTNPVSGGANLTQTGGGTLTLLGANTYSGNTTIGAGKILLGNASALPKGTALMMGAGSILDLAGFNAQLSGLTDNNISAIHFITNSSLANTSTITFSNNAANSIFGGSISGNKPIAFTLLGGSLTLTAQNSYAGNLFVSNGKLALSGAGSTFSGAQIVLSNFATLDLSGMGGLTLGAGQNLSGSGVITGSMTAANCPISAGTIGTAGVLSFSNNLTLNGNITNHFDLAADPAAASNDLIVVAGVLNVSGLNTIDVAPLGVSLSAGTYKLFKFGSLGSGGTNNFQLTGTLGASLQAAINVTATEVDLIVSPSGGTQRTWVGDGSLNKWDYTTTNWLNGAALDVFNDGNFVTFDDGGSQNPAVNLTTTLQPAAVLVNATGNYIFSGSGKISGTGTLTKTNSGVLTILTTNNYSGLTTISQGTLQVGNGAVSGFIGAGAVQNSGAFVLNEPGVNIFSNVISGAGNFVQAGSGTTIFTASNIYSGGTTISNGVLQLNTGAWFGNGSITNHGLLAFNHTGSLAVGVTINGTGALTLRGGGTLILTGNNFYSGGTTVSNGTLFANNPAGSAVGSGPLVVSSGATLSGGGIIGGAVTINSGGIFSPGNPVGTLTISNNFMANSGAILNYTLGTTSDKTIVSGNLNLAGTLNVTAGAGFTSGTFTLFNYGGALALGNLILNLPANSIASLDTNTPGQVNLIVGTLQTNIIAFPGALGFGANATGARISGSVYHVTTLADSGTGSFRDAVSKGNRFVVFDVGGTIALNSVVSCSSSLTIAGQTAPGGGIAIIGHEVSFSSRQNEIVRYVRIRPYSSSDGEDGINVGDGTNMIFDHISLEISPYNNIDAHGNQGSDAITVQNSIIADPASNGSSHKQGFGAHCEHIGGKMAWYYNLWVSEHNRQPMAKIDTIFVNNTEYNFQAGYTVANTSGHFRHDIINNYWITGPTDTSGGNAFYQMNANQTIYSSGNLRDNNNDGVLNGSSISPGGGGPVLSAPWSSLSTNCTILSPASAARYNLSWSGAMPHDQLDDLVVSQVKTLGNGPTGTGVGTAGPGGGLYDNEGQTGLGNGGFGVITGGTAPLDSDQDGLPDYWELALGSNPNVADSLTPGTGGYAKLENYLNWLAVPHAVAPENSFVDVDLRQYTGGFTNVSPIYAAFAPTNGTVALLPDGHTAEFTAAGNFSGLGSFNFYVHASDGTAMTNTVAVLVTATSASQNLIWHGDGTANNWDNLTTSNWLNGTNPAMFNTNDDATFDDTGSDNPAINLVGTLAPASITVAANQNYSFSGTGTLAGAAALSKSGAGILTIGNSNSFSGGTFVNGGSLVMANATANQSGLGTGALTLNDGTALKLFDAGTGPDAGTLPNNLIVSGTTSLELPERGGAGGTLTGSGNFNLITHWVRGNFNYDSSAFTGALNVFTPDNGGADFRIGSYAGFSNAVVNLSNNINAYFIGTINPAGNTVDIGEIHAPASATLRGGPTGGRAVTLRLGTLGTDSTFAGPIVEQNLSSTTALIKIGGGTLTLGGADSYSGTTTVSNGVLVVNGSTGTNSLVVANGTLGGSGFISGGVQIYSGNAISPGADIAAGNAGTLTITNGFALTNSLLYFDLANVTNAGASDLISLAGGALILSGNNTVIPNFINGFVVPGNYTLISGGSSTTGGAANFSWGGPVGSRQNFSFNTATPGTVLLNVAGSPPATLLWSGTNGPAWDTSTANWLNAGVADVFYNYDSVIFNDASTNGSVVISGNVQPAFVLVTNSLLNYAIGGGVLGGPAQLVKNGSGILYLNGSNNFSGGTIINNGVVFLTNDIANQFGLGTGSVTLNGGTLTMFDNTASFNAASWNLIVPTNATGNFNSDSRCDLYGSLTGGGTLNFKVTYVRTSLYGDWSAFAGKINVNGGGEFRVLNFSGYPSATLNLSNNVTADFQGAVDPAGTTLAIGALSGVSSSQLLGGPTAGNIFTWQIGGANSDAAFAGTITEQNTNAITAIQKIGGGVWTLTGNNSFRGGLTVSTGTLRVNNLSGSATGTNQVFVATGATLAGNGIIGGLTTLDDGAILSPGNPIGTLTISNELDVSDLGVLQFDLGTNSDKVNVSGDLSLGGQLNISDAGNFSAGTYTLFTYGGALTMGNFYIASAPANFIYTINTNTPGQVKLVVTRPQFNSVNTSGNNLVMSGSGGPANGNYYVLGSTNLALPLNLWTRLVTNQFDASGNFSFTNVINANAPQKFYQLQLP